ncbi:MAG: peptidoglycan-binding protein [Acidobacteria bacterium]|nr:peptidoglycan-binding protein [Acidobacteriota bacterium]
MTDHDIFTATSRPSADGDGPAPFADGNSNELVDLELPRTRRWPFLVIGVLIGIGATLGAVAYLGGSDDAEVIDQVTVDLATAILERRDLVEEIEWGAELGYGEAIEVAAPADGTITATVEVNTLVNRGDVLFSVDETPFVVFFGETPLYRTLTEGDEGPDVKLLETNLVVLGYDPDGTVTVDETFTSSTEDMVQRWQEDLGIEETGSVEPESVLLVEGPISVDEPAPLGQVARSGSAVATISPRLVTDTVVGPASGEITALAEIGTRIRNGTVVYGADGVDVVALTSLDAIGTFLTDPSTETSALENALIEGGYDPDDTIVVDDVVDDATYAAIGRWRTDRGLEITSGPAMTAYVSVTPGLEVSSRLVTNGAVVETSRPILEAATATLSVTVAIGLGDRDSFSVGDAVQVKLSDDSVLAGRVR